MGTIYYHCCSDQFNMRFTGILMVVVLKVIYAETRMLPINYETEPPIMESVSLPDFTINDNSHESALGIDAYNSKENEEYGFEIEGKITNEKPKKPCAIVVLSNVQNPSMQSLLRKYRYDANGILIPNSVKYFMKLPQGMRSSPLLVPLNDKAFSPLGGFVRYYKEVPPIPQAW
ncbi:uncharacterized protein [Epargyreus clarus]|uniref:uncharacterized protein n=1 Tax=Epargyreus clarus TaxID=520877 RepID=UPI003C2D10AF